MAKSSIPYTFLRDMKWGGGWGVGSTRAGKYIAGDSKRVGRFFLGDTPKGSAILGDPKRLFQTVWLLYVAKDISSL